MYSISKKQFLGGGMAVGNAYPEINTINTAEQTVDMLHVKRGNPYLPKISMYSASANYSVQFGRFNLFGIFMYDTEINTTLPAFFIEGDKVVETFRGDGDYHSFRGGLDLSYKVTDALRLKISGRWQRGLITGTEKEHENSVYGKLDINYFWKDFCAEYLRTNEKQGVEYEWYLQRTGRLLWAFIELESRQLVTGRRYE